MYIAQSAANSHIYSHYLTCMDARALTMTTGVHTISALINRTMTTESKQSYNRDQIEALHYKEFVVCTL